MYKLLVSLEWCDINISDWLIKIKSILNECEMAHLWIDQGEVKNMNYIQFKKLYKEKLKKYFVNKWLESMKDSSKCSLYRNFKVDLVLEKYFVKLNEPFRSNLIKFRTSNHMLPIERGRHLNIERIERRCKLCDVNDIGDEYHYLFCCSFFAEERKKFIPKLYYKKPSVQKFCELMMTESKRQSINIAKFASIICKTFKDC